MSISKSTSILSIATLALFSVCTCTTASADESQSQTKGSFTLDATSKVKFYPAKYQADISPSNDSSPPDLIVYLTEAIVPNLKALDPQPKLTRIPARSVLLLFKNGRPALNHEYRLSPANAPGKEAVAADWRRADLRLMNDDKSTLFVHFTTFARPGGDGAAVKEALVTYTSLPERAGDELRLKFALHFDDGGIMSGSFAGPVQEPPRIRGPVNVAR